MMAISMTQQEEVAAAPASAAADHVAQSLAHGSSGGGGGKLDGPSYIDDDDDDDDDDRSRLDRGYLGDVMNRHNANNSKRGSGLDVGYILTLTAGSDSDLVSTFGEDDPTNASSTYGDDRVFVTDEGLRDPYGDEGTYTGTILESTTMPHGRGTMVYTKSQRVYEGYWRHGRWHGLGRLAFPNGDVFEGEYHGDMRHGRGVFRYADGRVFDGNFADDRRHGRGVFSWPDGSYYDGDFVRGDREGHGVYVFCRNADNPKGGGGRYEGQWKDGRYDGQGTCQWDDGRRYEGEWKNGMYHGRGTETDAAGRVTHSGLWSNNKTVADA
jgi:hypothetical protein